MRLHLQTDRVRLYHGDASAIASVVAPESIDAIVTDPPAGIAFMGKAWDEDKGGRDAWIAWLAGIMRTALVLMKPGGHALVWALPRTSHWTATAIEDAGFEIRDKVMHLFGTGFPKSLDIAKAIDERKDWKALQRLQGAVRDARVSAGISQSEAARRCGLIASDESLGGGGFMWFETGMRVPTREQWPRLKAALGLADDLDAAFEQAEREVIGQHPEGSSPAGFVGERFSFASKDITAPSTPEAIKWQGWGTALKPAAEEWILARKPLAGTVASNILAFGTGGLNIDGCRVSAKARPLIASGAGTAPPVDGWGGIGKGSTYEGTTDLGRWPAHLVLDEVAAEVLDAQSGTLQSGLMRAGTPRGPEGVTYNKGFTGQPMETDTYADSGGASRFFYVAKATRAEKDAGLDHLPLRTGGEATDREDGSAGLPSPRAGAGRGGGIRNHHPTVKSIDLMRWLCRLITPPGGTVLDLFAGSGTTGLAALREGFRFVGVEQDAAFVDVAAGRLAHVECVAPPPLADEKTERVETAQRSLFDLAAGSR